MAPDTCPDAATASTTDGAGRTYGDGLPRREELVVLYDAVGWGVYTSDPDNLERAVRQSLWVSTARDARGQLVGLVRVVGDDATIAWVQDLLVHPDHQRQGVGTALLRAALERFARARPGRCSPTGFAHVRQLALLTDSQEATLAFYRSLGLLPAQALGTCCYVRDTAS